MNLYRLCPIKPVALKLGRDHLLLTPYGNRGNSLAACSSLE